MGKLTESMPKSMLPIGGKPILEYKLDALPDSVDEVILVVKYLGSVIQKHFGGEYGGKRILYIEQEGMEGTAGALWQAKDILKGKFLAMNGDDIYSKKDTEHCLKHEWAILVHESDAARAGGRVVVDKAHHVTNIEEGAHHGHGKILVNTGLYVLDERIFMYEPVLKEKGSEEYGLPQTMMQAVKDIHIQAVPATSWLQITTPHDLQKAEELLAKNQV